MKRSNEVWISDRDRFSYQGVTAKDRLTAPMIKLDGTWQTMDWEMKKKWCLETVGNYDNYNKAYRT